MTIEDIADGVVALLNAIDDDDRPIQFKAENPEDVAESYGERGDVRIFVLPKGISETAIDQGGETVDERVTVSVVINGPIGESLTRRKYLALEQALRASLRGVRIGRYIWDGNESVSLWDSITVNKGQFLSLFETTYFDVN